MKAEARADAGKLLARAGVVGAGTLFSRLLGLARDMTIGAIFSRAATDAFFVAFTIPNMFRQLLGEGAVSSAVVPVMSATLEREGDDGGRRFFGRLEATWLVLLTALTVAGVLGARPLVLLFTEGYDGDPAQLERVVQLTRILFPYIFFMGLAAIGMAALHTHRRFAVAAFAPALLNVSFVLCAWLLPSPLEAAGVDRAVALGIAALLGGLLQVVAQWPALARIGYLKLPDFHLNDREVREVFRRIVPMTVGIGIYSVDLVLSRRFLSGLGTGAQSYFSWASRICDLPQGIFTLALSTAALPTLSTLHARGEREAMGHVFAHGLRLTLFVALPCAVALAVLGEPLVMMLFRRGQFDALAVQQTARALVWQGGAIVSVAVVRQSVPVFYAMGNTRTPVVVSGIDLLAFIALAFALRGPMGHAGISAAIAGSSVVQMVLLLHALGRKAPAPFFEGVIGSALRTGSAAALAGVAGWGAARLLTVPAPNAWEKLLPGIASGSVFVLVFLLAAWGLRSRELDEVAGAVGRRLRRTPRAVLTRGP